MSVPTRTVGMILEKDADRFAGRTVERVAIIPTETDSYVPFSACIRFTDGSSLTVVGDRILMSEVGRATEFPVPLPPYVG